MLRDTAYCRENRDRFISRAAKATEVYSLSSSRGFATCESYDHPGREVLLFFSDAAYARRARLKSFPDYAVQSITTFDFLYRWLPGMSGDGVLAGPNWTGDMVGLEVDPFDLRELIELQLGCDRKDEFEQLYRRLAAERDR